MTTLPHLPPLDPADARSNIDMVEAITDLIGHTPLVRIRSLIDNPDPLVVAKVEYFNPGGSVKDRIAERMIDEAEKSGALQPGGTIVEPTSGNTGVGLAMVAQQRGYRCIFVCPDKVSTDKIAVLRAYGAQVEVCPTAVPPEDPRSYYSVSDRLARETPLAWKPDQYSNPANPMSHYLSTGPEIWEQTKGMVTHFVAGMGTGGTISGVGKYLKEVSDGRVKIIGADPVGSVYSGGTGRPYLVEGVGEDFWPSTYDSSICDDIIEISDQRAFEVTRALAAQEGLLVGGSCGLAMAAAIDVAQTAGPDDVIVVLLPDSGRGYLSKVFNDEWMQSFGFLPLQHNDPTAGEILASRDGSVPKFVHAHPNETIRDVIDLLRTYNVSQVPVVSSEPPVLVSEMVGMVTERQLLDTIFTKRGTLADPIARHMSPPMRTVGAGEPVSAVVRALRDVDAIVVLAEGRPIGVLTRQDLLNFATD